MKKLQATLFRVLSLLAITASLVWLGQTMLAQQAANSSPHAAAQQQTMPQEDPSAAPQSKTFTGKIVQSGDKLVLSDSTGKTTYQLDDQQKAQEFVNKNVKVTGVLDASTGMIRVSAIDPA